MVLIKIVMIYFLIGAYLGFIPMLDPQLDDTFKTAKEEIGTSGAIMIMLFSAVIVFLFWPVFLIGRKVK